MAKPHDDIRAAARRPNQACQLWAQARDLHRLVDEGMLDAERCRLQRKALVGLSHADPIGFLACENSDPSGEPHLADVLVVLGTCFEHQVEQGGL